VAEDDDLLAVLEAVPPEKRQPNLLLAVVRFLFGTQPDPASFRRVVLEHRDDVVALLATRRTQTNEPGRCAPLLPVLARLPQPLALLEVGASAGLCLLPDRYGYELGRHRLGAGPPIFPCALVGGRISPRPRLPQVAWRAGIDLEPVELGSPDAVRWLEALVWPEEKDRLARLRQAVSVARRDRPRVVRGNLVTELGRLAAQAPRDATLVVFHTAVLTYLADDERERFRREVMRFAGHWIAVEGPRVVPGVPATREAPYTEPHLVISLDGGSAVACCDPHGRWLQWLG
jgi:hypothetical protein